MCSAVHMGHNVFTLSCHGQMNHFCSLFQHALAPITKWPQHRNCMWVRQQYSMVVIEEEVGCSWFVSSTGLWVLFELKPDAITCKRRAATDLLSTYSTYKGRNVQTNVHPATPLIISGARLTQLISCCSKYLLIFFPWKWGVRIMGK